ncbi:MAG: NUDIX domain-containing protein [Thermoplasmata archaeon]
MDERSAGIILFRTENNKRKYLLLHYPAGHWDYPKGHVEPGESIRETALRELREETGIHAKEVELMQNFMNRIDYIYQKGRDISHKEVFYLLGNTETRKISISKEHQGYAWLNYYNALDRLTFQNARNVLKKAEIYLSNSY